MNFAFITDPVERMKIHEESTFFLMAKAQGRGHRLFLLELQDLLIVEGKPFLRAREAKTNKAQWRFDRKEPEIRPAGFFDAVFMRKDPPFDVNFLHATLLLDRAADETVVLNEPNGLRLANEKMYALNFPDLIPQTWVSRDPKWILKLFLEQGRELIAKPLDNCDGRGVARLTPGDPNAPSIIDMVSEGGQSTVMIQEHIAAVAEGDKRVFVLGGKPFPYGLNRVPKGPDFRARGGDMIGAPVTPHEIKMVGKMSKRLMADGIHFAGLDVIGGKITEINVTSPGLMWRVSKLNKVDFEGAFLDYVEGLVKSRRGKKRGANARKSH